KSKRDLAVLNGSQGFIFKVGERCVPAQKTYRNQVSPIRTPVGLRFQESQRHANEKGTRNVDKQGPIWETTAQSASNIGAHPETHNRSQSTPDSDHQVFEQVGLFLSASPPHHYTLLKSANPLRRQAYARDFTGPKSIHRSVSQKAKWKMVQVGGRYQNGNTNPYQE